MARSRYATNKIIDANHFGTWRDPTREQLGRGVLDDVTTVEHSLIVGERLDTLAARYYGDEELWWVIALANRIKDPFSLRPGMRLQIPLDARAIIDKVQR